MSQVTKPTFAIRVEVSLLGKNALGICGANRKIELQIPTKDRYKECGLLVEDLIKYLRSRYDEVD